MFFKLGITARILPSLFLALAIPFQLATAAESPVALGSAANFVVLAGSTVTSSGATIITGDLGLWPGTAVTGFPPGTVIGTMHVNDPIAQAAQGDLTTAFNDAAGRSTAPVTVAGNLGGQTLAPGLYKSTSSLEITAGDLTLDGQGDPNAVFIFQMASTFTTTSGRKVILIGGAQSANVFWQVGTSATIGTTSVMKGTIMADQSVSILTGATLDGRALARIGAVTLDGNGANLPVFVAAGAEIAVEQPVGVDIADGGSKDFGSVMVGNNTSLVFTIKNTGNADLTGLGITIDGADASLFSVTTSPVAPVSGPAGSTTFTVRFAPLSTGLKTAALHIANNDSDENPFDITITGTGSPIVAGPEIAVEQPVGVDIADGGSKDFGSVMVGNNTSLVFTIKNTGNADLTGLGITIDGVDASLFSITTSPVAPVSGPAGSTTFTVRFAPLTSGLKTAALHIANNDSNENPFDITITGTGAAIVVITTNIVVSAVSPITLNPQTGLFEQTVRLSNSSGSTAESARLLIQGLPSDVRVYNASGNTGGTPFVQYNHSLAPAAEVDLLVEYYRANRQPIPQPTFVAQATVITPLTAAGTVIAIDRNVQLTSGRFLIEFTATPGRTYSVQYSSDMQTWSTANPSITAPANRVQWHDDGPPKTESKPTSGSRFYRVIQLP